MYTICSVIISVRTKCSRASILQERSEGPPVSKRLKGKKQGQPSMRREMLIISRLTSGCVRALKARTRPLFFPLIR